MPRRALPLFSGFLAVLLFSIPASAATPSPIEGTVHFTLGPKWLDDDFEPAENQYQFGASVAFGRSGWPVQVVVEVTSSEGEDSRQVTVFTPFGMVPGKWTRGAVLKEVGGGVQKTWRPGRTRLSLAGGFERIRVKFEQTLTVGGPYNGQVFRDGTSDPGTGYWLAGATWWPLGLRFDLGADLRYSSADVAHTNANGLHAGLLLGCRF
jgi:hypothetical protein